MRIAMLVRAFSRNGGLELYTYKLIAGLLDQGHDLTVVCEVNDSELEHPRLHVRKFTPAPAGSRKSARLLHYLEHASASVRETGPYDIVHSQHLPVNGANVVTFHNHTAARLATVGFAWERLLTRAKMNFVRAYQLRDKFDRMLCSTASCLIFPSRICQDDFLSTYNVHEVNPRAVCAVAHPGGQLHASEASANKQGSSPFTFLFVGKGFRKKGLDVLLAACAILQRRHVDFKLIIAGLRAKPIDRARLEIMGLSGSVEYLGFCKDMHKIYERASATVLPSRIEPFGMAPLEGAAGGLVPIVSSMCGAAEVIEHGVNGYILKNHLDAQELAGLMQSLIDNPSLAARMGNEARDAAAGLTWDQTVQATLNAYDATLIIIKS